MAEADRVREEEAGTLQEDGLSMDAHTKAMIEIAAFTRDHEMALAKISAETQARILEKARQRNLETMAGETHEKEEGTTAKEPLSPRAIRNWVTATWVAAGAGCFMSLLWKHLLVGFDPCGAFESVALLTGVISVVFSYAFGGNRERRSDYIRGHKRDGGYP